MLVLNPEQQAAVDGILGHVRNPESSYFTVKGGGGVGKSTSVFTAIKEIVEVEGLRVLLAAPTHKAVNVLRAMSEEQGIDVNLATLASALGLRALPEEAQMKFVKGDTSKMQDYDVLVVDECSQIGEKSLIMLLEEATRYNVILIFMGDNCQLFPVKSFVSPVFEGGTSATLTKVMRYTGDILVLATEMRKIIAPEDYGLPLDLSKKKINIRQMCRDLFPNGSETIDIIRSLDIIENTLPYVNPDDIDASTIACWTNDCADDYNNRIHAHIHREMADYITGMYYHGDVVLPQDPVMNRQAIVYPIDAELVVQSVETGTYDLLNRGSVMIDYFIMKVRHAQTQVPHTINVVAEHHIDLYKQAIKEIAGMCRNRELYWSDFWTINNFFTPVKRPFARTTHKAQGSTYRTTTVDAFNINECPQVALHNRMIYTAITRAADRLIVGV